MTDLREELEHSLSGTYTVERELGGGGMSRVFVASENALSRRVVIKVLPLEMAAGVSMERFRREVMLAARLQHPHIVPLLSAGEANGVPYLTMPFVDGESLRARLARGGELPIAEGVRILREVASALDYAHEEGIVHRDIKPDNVLLSHGSAMVTDFGVAKAISSSSNAEHRGVTSDGVALGTPAYMSPEQAAAAPNIDTRADIYAFGVLAYELFAGRPPFMGRAPQALLAAHVSELPERIEKLRPSLPPSLATLIMRCLAKRPADRPQRASEIVHTLDAITTPSGVSPLSAGRLARSWQQLLRRPQVWVSASAFVVLVAAAVIIARARLAGGLDGPVMLAVLPENEGQEADDYFSDGLAEAISDRLASVPTIGVIAQRSAKAYKRSTKTLTQIGQELGVQYVLQTTVRSQIDANGSRTSQVRPRLVRVSDGVVRWAAADPYVITPGDEFAAQSEIASRVASALDVAFSHSNSASTGERPTSNQAAYEAYLRGVELESQFDKGAFDPGLLPIAAKEFERAVQLDTTFALAQAKRALVEAFEAFDGDPSKAARAKRSVDRALELAPNSADAYLANGVLLSFAYADPSGAIAALERASRLKPRDARILGFLGDAKALAGDSTGLLLLKRSIELDPVNAPALSMAAGDFAAFRQFREAEWYLDRWGRLIDDSASVAVLAAHYAVTAHGDTARAVRQWDAAARIAKKPTILMFSMYGDLTQGVPRVARLTLDSLLLQSSYDTLDYYIGKGIAALRLTQQKTAEAYADSVRALVRTLRPLPGLNGVARTHGALIAATWIAGRTEEFGREVDSTIAGLARYGPRNQQLALFTCLAAEDYGSMRDVEKAILYGERCLTLPSGWTSWNFRFLPDWEGIRSDAKVQAFLKTFGTP